MAGSESHWNNEEAERSLPEIASALAYIARRIATDKAINLHCERFLYRDDAQRLTVIGDLRWADVGRKEIRILSDAQARTKSGRWRVVPISDGAGQALQELRSDVLFVLLRIRPESLSRAFDRTAIRAEVDGHIHCLRHTYVSHLVQAGVPLRTVQILAGHASYRTTERYAHLAPGHPQEAVRALSI
ncbi:MAG: tyrosine-type recombinase/integrase [Chromatiaceae bacterium]